MLEIDVLGVSPLPEDEVSRHALAALGAVDVVEGHLAIEFVSPERIAELNKEFLGKEGPTDVLSFLVDPEESTPGPRELGDILICPEHTADVGEAIVHGVLHLVGMDHEVDNGEMLALQQEIMDQL